MLNLPPEGFANYQPDKSPNCFTPLFDLVIEDARVVACIEVFPEGGEPIPPHMHQATEIFVVLAGEGEARLGDEPWQDIEKGTAIVVPPKTTHTIRNTGGCHLVCLTLMTPGEDLTSLFAGARKMGEIKIVDAGRLVDG